jgi:hypothetical protein
MENTRRRKRPLSVYFSHDEREYLARMAKLALRSESEQVRWLALQGYWVRDGNGARDGDGNGARDGNGDGDGAGHPHPKEKPARSSRRKPSR